MNIHSNPRYFGLVFLAVGTLFFGSAMAAQRSGQQVVQEVCSTCHASGKDGAPRIGNVEEWTKHSKNGLVKLTEHAISGFGKMPAHGGQANLTDLEMSRAVAFMVSFGHSVDPNKPYASPTSMTGEKLVQERCVVCHETGELNAPRIDDFAAWKPRLQKGVEALVMA